MMNNTIFLISFLIAVVSCCSPSFGWVPATLEDQALAASIVVTAKVVATFENPQANPIAGHITEVEIIKYFKGVCQNKEKVNVSGWTSSASCGFDAPVVDSEMLLFLCSDYSLNTNGNIHIGAMYLENNEDYEERLNSIIPWPMTDDCPPIPQCGKVGTDCTTTQEGVSFASGDKCNTCFCTEGNIACTEKACLPDETTKPIETSSVDCGEYKNGDTFPSDDGCNVCTCSNGQSFCTEKACPKKDCGEHKDGETYPSDDGCNICSCENGQSFCTEKACIKTDDTSKDISSSVSNVDCGLKKNGETFDSDDGCNICSCENGQISCTELACDSNSSNILVLSITSLLLSFYFFI